MKKTTLQIARHRLTIGLLVATTIVVGGTILLEPRCLAQGFIYFENGELSGNIQTVYDVDGKTPLGPGFWVQLYAAPIGSASLAPIGSPLQFLGDGIFFSNDPVTIPGVPLGGLALGQAKAWRGSDGSSFEAADHLGGHVGMSDIFTMRLDTGTVFGGSPAWTWNLRSFSLYVVPEPPVAALTALGVVALRLFSSRGRHRRRARRQ